MKQKHPIVQSFALNHFKYPRCCIKFLLKQVAFTLLLAYMSHRGNANAAFPVKFPECPTLVKCTKMVTSL